MIVTINEENLRVENHGSVVVLTGQPEGREALVRFGVEPREAEYILAIIDDQGEIDVQVEGWQVMGEVSAQ